jgi:hypothetical protein
VPGVGPKIAFAFSAYVNADRYENGGQVSNYLELVPWVYMSGSLMIYGGIMKGGNEYLRGLLVQGVWAMTWSKEGGALRERYEYIYGRKRDREEDGDSGDSTVVGRVAVYTDEERDEV